MNIPCIVCTKNFWVRSVRWYQYILRMAPCVDFFVMRPVEKIKHYSLILSANLTHTHSNLIP